MTIITQRFEHTSEAYSSRNGGATGQRGDRRALLTLYGMSMYSSRGDDASQQGQPQEERVCVRQPSTMPTAVEETHAVTAVPQGPVKPRSPINNWRSYLAMWSHSCISAKCSWSLMVLRHVCGKVAIVAIKYTHVCSAVLGSSRNAESVHP